MNNRRQNGQVFKLIFFVSLTLFGLIWLVVDMNTDKKSTSQLMEEFDGVQEETTTQSLQQEEDSQKGYAEDTEGNSYDTYSVDELSEGQSEEEVSPELFDGNSD